MSNTPTLISDRIGPIVEPLHEAFERSRDRFNSIPGLTRDGQGWARTHFLRCFLWQDLTDQPLPDPWMLTGRHEQNGAITLAYGSGELKIRVVHAFPAGEVPPAGSNHARRAYYSNQALSEMSDPDHMLTHRCLLTWGEDSDRIGPFELTIVRPLGTGSLRSRVKADVYLPLPRVRTAFEDLEFNTADEEEMLEFDIDEGEGDIGNTGDGQNTAPAGRRVIDLRWLLGMTQQELSNATGIAQSNLSDIERSHIELTSASIHRICAATGTPATYFDYVTPEYSASDINFRKKARVTAKSRDFVIQAFKEIERVSDSLAHAPLRLKRVTPPLAEESDITRDRDVELFAQDVREAFGLNADEPIRNVTRMLERAGVAVAPLSVPLGQDALLDGHCGMSRWAQSALRASVIFITGMGGDRQRFTLSHEFGHVLLHTHRRVQDVDEREREADQFAGALLLPEPVARASVSESLTLQGYMKIKATYGISMAATITRGRRLGLISRDRQRSLMIQISSRGWRTDEPVRVKGESPMLLWTELNAAHGTNPYFPASTAFGIAPRLLEDWIPPRDPRQGRDASGSEVVPFGKRAGAREWRQGR